MKKTLRSLSLIVAFCLAAAFVPLLRGGGTAVYADGDFTIVNGVLTRYTGSGGDVTIPDGVTSIGENAFYNKTNLTSVTMPDSVIQINSFAFYACYKLKNVHLSSNLIAIGTSAFLDCDLQSLTLPDTLTTVSSGAFSGNKSLTSVNIPAGLTRMEPGVFAKCTSLQNLNVAGDNSVYASDNGILFSKDKTKLLAYPAGRTGTSYTPPDSVTEIGERAFYGVANLESVSTNKVTKINAEAFYNAGKLSSVTLSNNVTYLGDYAFEGCTSLTSFTVPSGVTTIYNGLLAGCTSLKTISVASGNRNFKAVSDTLLTSDGTTLLAYALGSERTEYNMPDTVKTVKWGAFMNAPHLKSVTLSRSLSECAGYCFQKCMALESVTIPEGVKIIGDYMFCECSALSGDLTIPSTVTYIGSSAFQETGYSTVYWNAKAPKIDYTPFPWSVSQVYYIGSQEDWQAIPMRQSGKTIADAFSGSPTVTCDYHPGLVIEDGIVKSYTGSGGIVVIPEGVTEIAERAFQYKSEVTEIALPSTLKTIRNRAFDSSGIKTVTIPASVESIGLYVFDYCNNLPAINVAEDNPYFCSSNGILYNKDQTMLLRCPPAMNVGAVTVPKTVTILDYSSFEGCEKVTGVILPEGLKIIQSYSFQKTVFTSITIPSTVTKISFSAFAYNEKLTTINLLAKAPYIYMVDNTPYAFTGCTALTTVNYAGTESEWNSAELSPRFPEGITVNYNYNPDFRIVDGVLEEYKGSGGDVIIPETVNSIRSYAFYAKDKVTSVRIPDSVYSIGEGAFYYCTGLKSVSFGSTVSRLYKQAFIGCSALESVTLPDGITEIPEGTFSSCTSLKSVTLPKALKTIDKDAFNYCSALTAITIPDSVTKIGGGAFASCKSLTQMTIPASVTQIGKGALYNCTSLKTVTIKGKNITVTSDGSIEAAVFKNCTSLTKINFAGTEAQWNSSGLGENLPEGVTVVYNYGSLTITRQPKSQSIILGNSLTISVTATGSGLKYQWYYKKKGAADWSVWNNRTNASETVTPNVTWDGIQLYCKVTDSSRTVNSLPATISVLSVSEQPKSQTITKGNSLTISVKATGSGLTYQWYFKKKGQTTWNVWNSRTHASETCTPNATWDGIQLYCIVKNSAGNTAKSNTVTVTVKNGPVITTQPTNQTVTAGNPVTLSLKASGTDLKYQWYFKKAGQTSFSVWNGRTHASETVSPNSTWNGIQLYCVVTDSAGKTAQSKTITVTVK